MKSFKIIAILVLLGFSTCSITEGGFLDQVKGKTAYTDEAMAEVNKWGVFSSDGRTLTFITGGQITFVSASDHNTAIYIDIVNNTSVFN